VIFPQVCNLNFVILLSDVLSQNCEWNVFSFNFFPKRIHINPFTDMSDFLIDVKIEVEDK